MTIDMHPWPPPPDRLSDLSDDILTHILSFAPTKEAASTTALSRRWRRPLWLDTAAVNLDSRSRTTSISDDNTLHFPDPDGRVIRKVSIVLRDTDIPGDAISKAVEAGFEELRLECQDGGCPDYTYATPSPPSSYDVNLSLDMLQMSSLRVLDLTGCKLSTYSGEHEDEDYYMYYQPSSTCWGCCYEPPNMSWDFTYQPSCTAMDISGDSEEHPWAPSYSYTKDCHYHRCSQCHKPAPPHITFPWLEALRLRRCSTSLNTLQTLIDASYGLTTEIRLESLSILQQSQQVSLCCRGVETIVMANLHTLDGTTVHGCRIELNAPHLRCLRLTQSMCSDTSFSLESPTPHLERVHLATHSAGHPNLRSSVLAAVSHIRFLKLTVYSLTDLIGDSDELPLLFPNLERLDIEELTCGGRVLRNHGLAASAVASMLRKCTALRELRFKFSWRDYLHQTVPDQAIRAAAMSDFRQCSSINAGNDEDCCCEGSELSRCRGCRLDCLKGSLRRVVVEFDNEELTCFQVRLVKFLVENATFLEEVVIKGRNRYESGWIDHNVAKWRDSHGRHLDKEEAERVCFYCCMDAGLLSMPPPTTPIPIWPPSLSKFPPLNIPLFSSGEVEDDDDDKDISHSLK